MSLTPASGARTALFFISTEATNILKYSGFIADCQVQFEFVVYQPAAYLFGEKGRTEKGEN